MFNWWAACSTLWYSSTIPFVSKFILAIFFLFGSINPILSSVFDFNCKHQYPNDLNVSISNLSIIWFGYFIDIHDVYSLSNTENGILNVYPNLNSELINSSYLDFVISRFTLKYFGFIPDNVVLYYETSFLVVWKCLFINIANCFFVFSDKNLFQYL